MAKIESIHVRLKSDDKKRLEDMSRKAGYTKLSDFIRDYLFDTSRIDKKEIEYVVFRLNKILESSRKS